jgi:hypothetical protein
MSPDAHALRQAVIAVMSRAQSSHGVAALTQGVGGLDYGCSEGSAEEALRDRKTGGDPLNLIRVMPAKGRKTPSKNRPSRIASGSIESTVAEDRA